MAYPTNDKNGAENLVALTLAIRTAWLQLEEHQGDLSALPTTVKTSLVAALTELNSTVSQIQSDLATKSEINDALTTGTNAWSALKTSTEIANAATNLKNDLLNGAGDAYDTLKELADLIETNQSAIEALQTIAVGHVHFDKAQSLTDEQKTQARSNIGAAESVHTHTIAQVTGLQAALDAKASAADVGDTNIDLVDIFANGVTE